jgi:hypothetical protein
MFGDHGFEQKFTTKADRNNEFPGQELEVEYALPPNIDTDHLAQAIRDAFSEDTAGPYQIAKSMPFVAESKTKHLRYSVQDGDGEKNRKLFVVNIRERDGVMSVKRKGAKSKRKGIMFRDESEEQLPFKEWTPEAEKQVKSEQGILFDVSPEDIIQTGETMKRKLKIRIENQDTKRIYSIGVTTKTKQDGRAENSLSIDYIGKEAEGSAENEPASIKNAVAEDIKKIKEKVLTLTSDIK